MKIGIYSPYLDTLTGGEKYILTAASFLSKRDDVDIFWDDRDTLRKASEKFNLDLEQVKVVPNLFTRKVSTAKRLLLTRKYDAILYLSDGSIPIVASKKLFIHFQFPTEWVNGASFINKIKLKRVTAIICNSNFTKKYIDKKFGVVSYVLYPPADINTQKVESKQNIILTVGRFSLLPTGEDFKKISVLLASFKEFQKKRLKGWRFSIVTSYREEQRQDFEIFKKNIKNSSVDIYENISHEKIKEIYSSAKIYWHAAGFGEDLERHPDRAEHFGISTVEAMSYGAVPVVAAFGGQVEIVEDGVNGYLWRTQDELVEKTHKLATDIDTWESFVRKAIVTSQRYSEKRFGDELLQIIK